MEDSRSVTENTGVEFHGDSVSCPRNGSCTGVVSWNPGGRCQHSGAHSGSRLPEAGPTGTHSAPDICHEGRGDTRCVHMDSRLHRAAWAGGVGTCHPCLHSSTLWNPHGYHHPFQKTTDGQHGQELTGVGQSYKTAEATPRSPSLSVCITWYEMWTAPLRKNSVVHFTERKLPFLGVSFPAVWLHL